MKAFGLIITLLMMFSVVADELPTKWIEPGPKDYDVRCMNVDDSHPKYRYTLFGKFYRCSNVPWAEEFDYECLAFAVGDNENSLVKIGSLTRGVYYVTEEIMERLEAGLDPSEVHYFDVRHMITNEFNVLDVDMVRSEAYPWGYDSFVSYQKDDTHVGTFPAICQFKNHFPEEG